MPKKWAFFTYNSEIYNLVSYISLIVFILGITAGIVCSPYVLPSVSVDDCYVCFSILSAMGISSIEDSG